MTKFSILDLVLINEGSTAKEALENTLKVAQKADQLGFNRIWVAEHHNMPSIASAATSVVIGYLAAGTSRIRVGAGGIMLPNHSPIVIAEQFGTLATLYPDRIDLGLGRAPGTDQRTLRALRKDSMVAHQFPEDVLELQSFFAADADTRPIQAVPASGLEIPLWILGSSTFGAQLAASLGLPYAFASHFAPDALMEAIAIYRQSFRPSKQLQKPYVMVGVNISLADTDKEARYHFSSIQQSFANMRRGVRSKFLPPIHDIEAYWSFEEKLMASHMLSCSFVGCVKNVRAGLNDFIEQTQADEIIVTNSIYNLDARLKSLELLSQIL